MNINEFAKKVALQEAGKKQVNIAQIKELLKIINQKTSGILYSVIKLIDKSERL